MVEGGREGAVDLVRILARQGLLIKEETGAAEETVRHHPTKENVRRKLV